MINNAKKKFFLNCKIDFSQNVILKMTLVNFLNMTFLYIRRYDYASKK